MNFSKIRLTVKAIVVLILMLVSALAWAAEKNAPGDKVALVNGVVISKDTYDRELDFFIRRTAVKGQALPDEQMAQMKNQVLESLIDRELLFQESKKEGIEVKAEAVSDQLQKIEQRYPNKEEFNKLLSEMGLTESDVQRQIARGMAIQQLIDKEITEKIKVSDEETRSFFDKNPQLFQQPEQVKARHILIKVAADAPADQKAEARKKIEAVQQKVKKGEDFETLAKTYSEGPSGPRGGDLGYFKRGQMVKPFEDAAFSLKPNETSEIVETRFGYHLIKVEDKKPAKKMTYAEVKDRLNDHLKKQKAESEADAYIETLRQGAKIEKFL
ncbi:MAG: peptidylprolyl isomerase [Deltaproteobacteria bacterium]|jgi:peptidyl-prolyl cis-trans isomerase C